MKHLTLALIAVALSIRAYSSETTNEVKTVVVRMMCDAAGCSGEMLPGGVVLATYPAQYPHSCTVCKTNRVFMTSYPERRYELKTK